MIRNGNDKTGSSKYIEENIISENLAAELRVIKLLLTFVIPFLCLTPLAYFTYSWLVLGTIQTTYFILFSYLVAVIVYYKFAYEKLKSGERSVIFRFINVAIEISSVTVVMIIFIEIFNADTIISGPLVMVYLLMTIMTGFRCSLRLSLFAGIMSAFQHLLLYIIYFNNLSPDLLDRLLDLGLPGIIQKSLYLLLGGAVAGMVATNTKKLIIKIANKSLETQEVKITFGQYVSEEIRDSILNGEIDINGIEREGVILFSDLRNFTTLLEKYPPQTVVNQLNEYFSAMVEVIGNRQGVVNKFIGDAIMSVFGLFNEDGPVEYLALNCALEMHRKLEELNKDWQKRGMHTLNMGIGISCGKFLTGNIGSRERKEFTCIGDVVNTASRLESLTKKYKKDIIIEENLKNRLPEELLEKLEFLGNTYLKGKEKELNIYSVSVENENSSSSSHSIILTSPQE